MARRKLEWYGEESRRLRLALPRETWLWIEKEAFAVDRPASFVVERMLELYLAEWQAGRLPSPVIDKPRHHSVDEQLETFPPL